MLSIFRTNQFILNVFLLFYAVILRFSAFFKQIESKELSEGILASQRSEGILTSELISYTGSSTHFAIILSLLLVFLQATLINLIVTRYRMANTLSLFPGLFYILLSSSFPEFLYLSAPLIANTFLIVALLELFGTYKKYNSAREIFNAGFWIAIGSLFYFSFILFLLLGLIALATLRSFKFKEALILLIGFLVPYIFANVYYFLTDSWGIFWVEHVVQNIGFFDLPITPGVYTYIRLGFFALLLFLAILNFGTFNFKKSIQVQKNIGLLYWCLLIAAFTLLLQSDVQSVHLLLLTVPLGIFLSFNFLKFTPPLAEAIHFILLVLILIYQFQPYLGF